MALESAVIRNAPLEDLKQVLRYAMMKVGLRAQNWPSDAEKAVLIDHIWKQYGGHTLEEIKLAFDMALAGKLDVEVNCYENFSCLYFSNIIFAYRAWSKEEYKQIPVAAQLEAPKEDISDGAMKEWLAEMVNRIKTPGYSFQFLPPMLYDWLAKKGKMNKTAAEKVAYLEKACQYRYCLFLESLEKFEDKGVRAQMNAFVAMVKDGEVTGPEIDVVEGITRRMILYDYLKTL